MQFTNENLQKMKEHKEKYNWLFSKWYYRLYLEEGGEIKEVVYDDGQKKLLPVKDPSDGVPVTNFNRADRISSCCNLWTWDAYHKNKLLDLKRLNRCMNSRFCPNCKKFNVHKFIHEFQAKKIIFEKYDFYMLTETIPSVDCDGVVLDDAIRNLYATDRNFNLKYTEAKLTPTGKKSKRAFQKRYVDFSGGVRVLEITYNNQVGFHPHLHKIICVPKNSVDEDLLKKVVPAKYSIKRKQIDYKSKIDVQMGKVWTMLWYGIDFRKYNSVVYDPAEVFLKIDDEVTEYKCLEVDFKPLDEAGVYEVFKYTFKSSEVIGYGVFKALVYALNNKRIRQGFGCLYDLKCDDDMDNGEKQALELEFAEDPELLLVKDIQDLITKFAEYKKISRFNATKDLDKVNIPD